MKNSRHRAVIAGAFVAITLFVAASVRAQAPGAEPAWPHSLTVNGASVVIYQPQAVEWPNHETLTTREAIAITLPGGKSPILGTTEISFSTQTDAASGDVILTDPHLVASHFPALDTDQATRIEDGIKKALPGIHARPVPLQAVLLSLKQQSQSDSAAVDNTPPAIFYSAKLAILVVFDGEPVMAPVGKTGLTFAANTNWDVFSDGQAWYLLDDGSWLSAPAYTGPYSPVAKLPAAFSAIPADPNFAAVRKAIPAAAHKAAAAPVVFVSTKPAEIIVTAGPPQFVPVAGTSLQVVKNTHNALFFEPADGRFFLLTSGRWFAAHGLDGPWSFATNDLPPDFALIPPNGPQAPVLASVPGTSQAQLAVLQAQVPRQATLKKDPARLTVVYAGSPQFKPIPNTPMQYAINTPYEVIETGGVYYVCYQGAWFTGPSPNGPWVLAASVPAVIYTIPPSFPLYNVTYVKVYGATPSAVTYGYTAGYMMGFVSAGVMVYGTGYYYPPVVLPGPVPIYYPYPTTYAGSVAYNPATGAWVHGGTVYGPYGAATGGTYYNPNTGAYGRGGSVYGPYGGASAVSYYNPSTGGYARGSASWNANGGYAQGSYYNPRTGVSGSTSQNANAYSRWGSSTFAGPNQTVHTQSGSNARGSAGSFTSSTGAEGAGYRGAGGNSGGAVKTQNGDVYAGHDGNAYQHSADGWSKWNNGGWQPVTPPSGGSSAARQSAPASTANGGAPGQAQNRTAERSQGTARQPMESSSYQQLEQDRQARFAGNQQRFGEMGAAGRFGAREGGGFHFRR